MTAFSEFSNTISKVIGTQVQKLFPKKCQKKNLNIKEMLPLSQKANRDIPKTSSSLLFLPFKEKQQAVPPTQRLPSLKIRKTQKAISLGITIPESAAKKTQMSKQICTTTWNTAQEEDRSTHSLVLLNYQGGQRNYSQKYILQNPERRQSTQVMYFTLHSFNTPFHFQMAVAEG